MTSNLATKLREGTKKAHTTVEGVGFIRCFLKGVVEINSYRTLLSNFYFIYSEMEATMRVHRDHPILGKLYFPELDRCHSLEQDLSFFYGANWKWLIVASPATQAYVQRIQNISNTEPELLIAHLYTRYMGDLSGGQILKKIAQRTMNLSEGQGLSFYEFTGISDAKQFKAMYRQQLDELPLVDTIVNRIVDEANETFQMNMKVFQELEGSVIKAIGHVLFNTLTRGRTRDNADLVPTD